MFSLLKSKLMIIGSAIIAVLFGVIKFLSWRNKKQAKKITTLENNQAALKQKNKIDVKRTKFNATQKQKVKIVNDETHWTNWIKSEVK